MAVREVHRVLRHVAQPRAHEYVAEQIRRAILLRVVEPGGRLPYEQELAAALGVSRSTITHALRLLEREGLVEVRRGRGGGVFSLGVNADGGDPEVVAALRAERATIAAAAELRAVVEPAVARLAAERADAASLHRLEDLNEQMRSARGDDHRFMRADTEFHLELAEAAGSPMLADAVERGRLALSRALEALPESPAWHERSVDQHARLLAALGEHDPARAAAAMERHVGDTNRALALMLRTLAG
jgi:GntR family transcriptional regulator, transcriptional repressor for pyruvate dehydrogenase complex